jgi:hypothetical protein
MNHGPRSRRWRLDAHDLRAIAVTGCVLTVGFLVVLVLATWNIGQIVDKDGVIGAAVCNTVAGILTAAMKFFANNGGLGVDGRREIGSDDCEDAGA